MKHRKIAASLALAFTSLVLAGCGSGPSEAEIEKIFKADLENTAKQMSAMGGAKMAKMLLPTLHGVKKLGCEKDGPGYLCDLELDVEQDGQRTKGAAKQRFIKGSDGWVVTK